MSHVPSLFEDGDVLTPFLSGKKEGKEVCLVQIPTGCFPIHQKTGIQSVSLNKKKEKSQTAQ